MDSLKCVSIFFSPSKEITDKLRSCISHNNLSKTHCTVKNLGIEPVTEVII